MTPGAELTLTAPALLRLLQLVSPAFPIGAFAYSQGLEQAVEKGWVSDSKSLAAWTGGLLRHVLAETDLPLLWRAHAAWSKDDAQEVRRLTALTLALRETRELRAEEEQLGSGLGRALAGLGIERARVAEGRKSYLVMFALAAHSFAVPPQAMLYGYAFSWLENQIIGATRLISMGQNEAQGVLSRVASAIPEAANRSLEIDEDAIGRCAVGVGLSSSWHEEQYSRLFRS